MLQFILTLFLFSQASPQETIYLSIEGSKVLPTSGLETLEIQRKGLLRVKDNGDRLIFVGKKLGQTTVKIGSRHYNFYILPKKSFETFEQLKKWQQGKRGPTIQIINRVPYLSGRILTSHDYFSLTQFTNETSTFRIKANLSPNIKNQVQNHIENILQADNLDFGELSFSPHLQYRIHKQAQISLYKKRLSPLGIEVRQEANFLNHKPVIKIKLYIAHVKKSFMRQWGVGWPSQVSAEWVPGNPVQWTNLSLALNALESTGQGKLLATPTLVTESHKKAEFHSGGEFPIRQTTQFTNSLQWKRYGLFLKVTPKTNSQKNMQIKIDLELSTLDQTQANVDVPSLQRSEIKTQINLKKPGPIFLSGLHKSVSSNGRSGLPWLQQIPLFKPLFSTGQIYDDSYELVFILAPSFYE